MAVIKTEDLSYIYGENTPFRHAALDKVNIEINDGEDFFKDKKKPRKIFPQAEKLKSIGLDLPQATELIWRLRNRGCDLPEDIITEEKCAEAVYRLLNGGA